jgi:hypothetical protein
MLLWRRASLDIPNDRLTTRLDVDLTDRHLFGFIASPIVERLDEFSIYCRSLDAMSKIYTKSLSV